MNRVFFALALLSASSVLAFPAAAIFTSLRAIPACDIPKDVAMHVHAMGAGVGELATRGITAHDDEVIAVLHRLKQARPERTVLFVRVDDNVSFERVVRFLDAARGLGYSRQALVLARDSRSHWCGGVLHDGASRISCVCFCG